MRSSEEGRREGPDDSSGPSSFSGASHVSPTRKSVDACAANACRSTTHFPRVTTANVRRTIGCARCNGRRARSTTTGARSTGVHAQSTIRHARSTTRHARVTTGGFRIPHSNRAKHLNRLEESKVGDSKMTTRRARAPSRCARAPGDWPHALTRCATVRGRCAHVASCYARTHSGCARVSSGWR